jgi:hypothetical protein
MILRSIRLYLSLVVGGGFTRGSWISGSDIFVTGVARLAGYLTGHRKADNIARVGFS